jgi:hypothetical protein
MNILQNKITSDAARGVVLLEILAAWSFSGDVPMSDEDVDWLDEQVELGMLERDALPPDVHQQVLQIYKSVMPGFFHLGDFRPEASFQSISDALVAALCSLRGDEGISLAGLDPRPRPGFLPIGPDALIQAHAIQ